MLALALALALVLVLGCVDVRDPRRVDDETDERDDVEMHDEIEDGHGNVLDELHNHVTRVIGNMNHRGGLDLFLGFVGARILITGSLRPSR